jgi:hypothetical protein
MRFEPEIFLTNQIYNNYIIFVLWVLLSSTCILSLLQFASCPVAEYRDRGFCQLSQTNLKYYYDMTPERRIAE